MNSRKGGAPASPIFLGAIAGLVVVLCLAAAALLQPQRARSLIGGVLEDWTGANSAPVHLLKPRPAPLSALAQLGREVFFDRSLSASGRQSCASCHSPERAYGPPNDASVQFGGAHLERSGFRPPPSLTYLYRQLPFSIGPDPGETDTPPPLTQLAAQARGATRAVKTAGQAPATPAFVPQGGLFWDGRSNTLQAQGMGPMMDPAEMANHSEVDVARKLANASYSHLFKPLFGANILNRPSLLLDEAMSAVSRYQIEDPSFHRFDSKYDAWLEGKARLTPAELRGMRLFNDPAKANCGGCHLSQPTRDGLPPLFTDTQYEALGVPRNPTIPANKDPKFFDLGICGPFRTDLSKQTQYCAMFLTPTLRNSAHRGVYFHNGVYHSLAEVLNFYNLRNTQSAAIYPKTTAGIVDIYNDIPAVYRANVDVADAPFDRKVGDKPPLSEADMRNIIAFINTLNDGYKRRGS